MIKPMHFICRSVVPIALSVCLALPVIGQRSQPKQTDKKIAMDAAHQRLSAISIGNLKQMAMGVLMYTQDWNETLPTLKNAAAVKKVIAPYLKKPTVFVTPDTKKPYLPNPTISGKKFASIAKPAETVLFYEPAQMSDGTRAVAYVDGHVRRLTEANWLKLKASQKIP